MVLLKSRSRVSLPATSSYSRSLLDSLMDQKLSSHDSVVSLSSGCDTVFVHTMILKKASKLISSLLGESCNCQLNTSIILPSSPSSTLETLVRLLYTGSVSNLSKGHAEQVFVLAKQVGMKLDIESVEGLIDEKDGGHSENENKPSEDKKAVESGSSFLNIETIVKDNKRGNPVKLCFPKSRIKRQTPENQTIELLSGFNGRVQKEYNEHSVGQYMGPYDQNENLKLNVQLPGTNLDFQSYTEFYHDEDECFEFSIKSYDKYGDLDKIGAYRIKAKVVELEERHSDDSDKSETDPKYYTCQTGRCKIPCPCPQCHLGRKQCTEHKLKHIALFDEKKHAISIRSSNSFCLGESFFHNSYVLKYSGIPIDCRKCHQDLVFHHSYHFEFHETCRFCKLTFYKLRATTVEEHHRLELKEAQYYKTVCPYCDKRFREQYDAKKHIEFEHEQKRDSYKCEYCKVKFQSNKAKQYHEMTKHSSSPSHSACDICQKTFTSVVNLKSHMKYVHSDNQKWSCGDCEARFKQKRDLRFHMLNVHNLNQRKEDYFEGEEKLLLKCKDCNSTFQYRKNLNAHKKANHTESVDVFQCEECPSKFRYKTTLTKHKRVKHGNEKQEHACGVCGKTFTEKKNMKRHERKHDVNSI